MSFMDFLNVVTFFIAAASVVCATTERPSANGFIGRRIYPALQIIALNVWKAK